MSKANEHALADGPLDANTSAADPSAAVASSDVASSGVVSSDGDPVAKRLTSPRRSISARAQPLLIALFSLLVLPSFPSRIGPGLDSSWAIAVTMAADRGMSFGRDVLFTFGPLGFLATSNLIVGWLGIVSLWVRVVFAFLIGWVVARSARRVLPWWGAAIIAIAGVWIVGGVFALGSEATLIPLILITAGSIEVLATSTKAVSSKFAAIIGALCGTSLLVKFDTGLWGALMFLGVIVLSARAVRSSIRQTAATIAILFSSFAFAVIAWWLIVGQSIGGLWRWILGSFELLAGYDRAMVADYGKSWELPVGLAVAGVTFLLGIALTPRGRKSYVGILLAGSIWLFAKQSFVRHDDGHTSRLFVFMLVTIAVLIGIRAKASQPETLVVDTVRSRSTRSPWQLIPYWLASASMLVCGFVVFHLSGNETITPSPQSLLRTVSWTISSEPNAIVRDQKRRSNDALGLTDQLRVELLHGSVHIEPAETSVAWAVPGLKWHPLPVLQSYAAFSPSLDNRNANALASKDGPDQLLFEAKSIDRRIARFESPQTMVTLLCQFHVVNDTGRWQLFRRNDQNKNVCQGSVLEYDSQTPRFGELIKIPQIPDDLLLVARFDGFEANLSTRIKELATRPSQYWIRIGDTKTGEGSRFVPGTARQPHIISVPACLRGRMGSFDSGSYETFRMFDTRPPVTNGEARSFAKQRRPRIRVRLEALPYSCPPEPAKQTVK